jgi:hypothetical protein
MINQGNFVGVTVSDGTPIIPRNGSSIDLEIPKEPCELTCSLDFIYYGGSNVGKDWQYDVAIDGHIWKSGSITHLWKTLYPVGKKIVEDEKSYFCNTIIPLSIYIKARERDFFIFDDIGEIFRIITVPCTKEPFTQRFLIFLGGEEYPSFLWRKFFRRNRQIAVMVFFFTVTTKCINPIDKLKSID